MNEHLNRTFDPFEPDIGKTYLFVHSEQNSKLAFAEYTLLNDGSENVYLRYRDGSEFGERLSEQDQTFPEI